MVRFNPVVTTFNSRPVVSLVRHTDYERMTYTDLRRTLIARNVRRVNNTPLEQCRKWELVAAAECSAK
jgi:hypothetical protein